MRTGRHTDPDGDHPPAGGVLTVLALKAAG